MKTFCLIVLAALLVTGCETPIQSNLVTVYEEGTTPNRDFEKVKLLRLTEWSSETVAARNYFVRTAENLNADAIIMLPHEYAGFKVYPFGKIGVKWRFKALAIKWTTPATVSAIAK